MELDLDPLVSVADPNLHQNVTGPLHWNLGPDQNHLLLAFN
jgi:hypothetical protein